MPYTGGVSNINVPREQGQSYDHGMPVPDFFRKTFFTGSEPHVTEHIDVDVRKGTDRIAPFVADGVGGVDVSRTGHRVDTFTPPRLAPERKMNKELLMPRAFGEVYHSGMSQEERQDAIMQRDITEMSQMIDRSEEIMCAKLLTTGQIVVKGYTDDNLSNFVTQTLDFSHTGINTLTGGDRWSETTADILGDLDAACDELGKKGYTGGNLVLGSDTWGYLKKDETFLKQLDNLNFEAGRVVFDRSRISQGQGVVNVGRYGPLNLQLWVYQAWYTDLDGIQKPVMPTKRAILLPSMPVGKMHYGAITQMEADGLFHTYVDARVPKILIDQNNDTKKIRISSRPLPVPYDIDSWYVYVVATE